jgi:sulfoxide reductase catalytic subunit YedY
MERHLKHVAVPSSELTSESVYLSRRQFLKAAGVLSATALLAACGLNPGEATAGRPFTPQNTPALTDELGSPVNSIDQITHYNNYYEFSSNKLAVATLSRSFLTDPWSVEVSGLVQNPKTYAIEDLLKYEQKERIYRLRCVEGWSMVIPWVGFELGDLLRAAEPTSNAKYVHFVTYMDRRRMPGEGNPFYPWPYSEGLRLDEAMHPLTILATGLYGHPLPNQDGAPLRLVVPWKYGFKGIKAIVKIELTENQPETFWNDVAPREYGFYANVNPQVDTPHWSQAYEWRIGELKRRPTLMFNGYGDEVASLYRGMDLSQFY